MTNDEGARGKVEDSTAVVLWAAPAGATLESSPGCNPGFGMQASEPRQGWEERPV